MAAVTIHSDFWAQENKVCHCSILFPIYFPWSDGTRCHDLSFLNVEFKPAFSQYTALMYSFPNFEPVHCSMYGSNCCFLTCIQVSQEASKVVWYPHLFKNFPVCFCLFVCFVLLLFFLVENRFYLFIYFYWLVHMVKGFSVVNEAVYEKYSQQHSHWNSNE